MSSVRPAACVAVPPAPSNSKASADVPIADATHKIEIAPQIAPPVVTVDDPNDAESDDGADACGCGRNHHHPVTEPVVPEDENEDSEEPAFTVVDRRFWSRSAADADADGASDTPRKPSYVEELERKVADAEARTRDTLEQHRAAKAEFENARARLQRDIAREIETGKRRIIGELLEVVDNLERAIGSANETDDLQALLQGVGLVHAQFLRALAELGVRKLTSLGQRFDPRRHEAVSAIPVAEAERDGEVIGVIKECYVIGDDTLRPGVVAVAKGPAA